jgi:hypothetical protein
MKQTLLAALAAASLTAAGNAALLEYTMTGTGVAGSVAGTAFTNATLTVTWTRDTASSTGRISGSSANLVYEGLVVSPTISIASSAGNWSGSMLLGQGVDQWQAVTALFTNSPQSSRIFMNGTSASGPVSVFGLFADGGGLFIDMLAPASVSAVFASDGGPFDASFGTVALDNSVTGNGTFTIAEVPAPGGAVVTIVAGIVARRRRR